MHLFGSLSATGKGHGTERAALAGIIGKEPATVDPLFLDGLAAKPDQTFPVKLGDKTFNVSLKDIIYDAPKGDFPHPEHHDLQADGRRQGAATSRSTTRSAAASSSGRATSRRRRAQPKYPYSTMKELLAHAKQNKLSIAQVVMANEVAVSGKSEAEINAFIDKIIDAMARHREDGPRARPTATLPGPIKLKTKAGDVYKRAMDDKYETQRGVGVVSAYALAGSEENARGHLVVTAPTGGSAGVMPALVYALGEGGAQAAEGEDPRGPAGGGA